MEDGNDAVMPDAGQTHESEIDAIMLRLANHEYDMRQTFEDVNIILHEHRLKRMDLAMAITRLRRWVEEYNQDRLHTEDRLTLEQLFGRQGHGLLNELIEGLESAARLPAPVGPLAVKAAEQLMLLKNVEIMRFPLRKKLAGILREAENCDDPSTRQQVQAALADEKISVWMERIAHPKQNQKKAAQSPNGRKPGPQPARFPIAGA